MTFLTTPDGVRLRYTDRGSGPPVVLVHGWKGSHRLFDPALVRLVRAGHRVVAFDLRGMGESDKPNDAYAFPTLAADLRCVLDTLGLADVTLVGWSMGCSVALTFLRTPDPRIARLVLFNGPIRLTSAPDFPWTMSQERIDAYAARSVAGWPESERLFQAEAAGGREDLAGLLYQVALQTPLDVALAVSAQQETLDFRDLLPRLPMPVLALYTGRDPYYPRELAGYIAQRAPRGEQVILEDVAHAAQLEAPDEFVEALLGFIGRTATEAAA